MDEQLIDGALARFANFNDWKVREELEGVYGFKVFDLEYYRDEGLHTLEPFAEGTFTIGKLRVERKYIKSGTPQRLIKKIGFADDYTYYTKVVNTESESQPIG